VALVQEGNVKIVHAKEPLKRLGSPSVFLAGPTPRAYWGVTPADAARSWRPEALGVINDPRWTVLVPEGRNWVTHGDYHDQVEWEYKALSKADIILFWVPRELEKMPGFTTNVEFGLWLRGRPDVCVLGHPEKAPKTRYLDWLYRKITNRAPCMTLEDTWKAAQLLYEPVDPQEQCDWQECEDAYADTIDTRWGDARFCDKHAKQYFEEHD
jgi:hypothetical protein